jgi:hypothetical protein
MKLPFFQRGDVCELGQKLIERYTGNILHGYTIEDDFLAARTIS